jgi:thiol-disulfide isomerase/thioredoxin
MTSYRHLTPAALLLLLCAAAAPAAEVPRPAPECTILLPGGKSLTLSQYKGKPVVLAFILTHCSHCQRTVGFLNKAQIDYGPRGLQILAAAIDENPQLAVPLFIRNFNPPFPVGYNTDRGAAALQFMQITTMPIMPLLAFIDRQGTIRAQFEGHDAMFFGESHEQNLRAQIEALLKPPGGVRKK